jgi:aminoglycoside phosphotransferase (APT) family kinase protein
MEQQALSPQLGRAQLDPLASPVLQRELPGLAAALDEDTMRGRLQDLLFGADARLAIERCNPGQAIYLAGDFCGLRYEMELRDRMSGAPSEALVIGRVFQGQAARAAYMRDKLAPVAARARGRADLAPFRAAAAEIGALNMVVHAFPIDGDLPVLLDVTDPGYVLGLLNEILPSARAGELAPRECLVELAHYGRQHRCTLRYTIDGVRPDGGAAQEIVYAKVATDGSGERTAPVLAEQRERLASHGVNVPRVLGFRPTEQLLLLESIPGKPQVARLLKARLAGVEATGPLTLERALADCGRIAAALHGSGIGLGRRRALSDELDWQARSIAALARVAPELGARLQGYLAQASARAAESEPLPLCFCHGDYTYTQLIFEGQQSGLVDFDTMCQAEPALDLGQLLAYTRLAILKDQRPDAPLPAPAVELLCEQFLGAYIGARGQQAGDPVRLRERAAVYELLMLLRLAVHSWQKLKVSRLKHALTLLEERVLCR